ncbi:MAG TPA: murein biosynthesis integral membrane protein MurJ [Candidatus Limnocylindrales bacterium]|nr:murein biosynthesis integral membrane protein MurJ [Candidatus Limnocylindrales bacterium]
MPTSNSLNDGQPPLSDERARLTGAAQVLAGMTALSRASGLVRDVVIGATFGTGAGADAFFAAFRLPNLFRRIAAEGAASAAFVPVFTSALLRSGTAGAAQAAAAVGGVTIVSLAVLSAIGMAAAEPLTDLLAPGFAADPEKRALTVSLTRWLFPYLLLVGTAAWAMGVLHTFRNFAVPAWGPVLLNASIIACAWLLRPALSPPEYALVIGVLLGGSLQVAVQVPWLLRIGLRPRMFLDIADAAVRRTGPLLVAAVFGGAVYQLNVLVATLLASLLPAGSVSFLWYADRLFEFPLGIVAVAVGTAALPTMAALAREERRRELAATVVHSLSLTLAWCLPAALGLLLLAPDIVELLLQRGRFTAHDTVMTAWALQAQAPGLIGVAAARVLSGAFYALDRPRVPVLAAALAVVANAIMALALMGPPEPSAPAVAHWIGAAGAAVRIADLRHAGLALATAVAASINAAILLVMLRVRLRELSLRAVLGPIVVHAGAAAVMAATVAAVRSALAAPGGEGAAVRVAAAMTAGVATYVAAAWAMGSAQIRETVGLALDWIRRR